MLDWFWDLNSTERLTALLLFANVVLVAITGYYAYQNRKMATEMKLARSTSVLPLLSLGLRGFAGQWANISIENVGNGPALHLRSTVDLLNQKGETIESHSVDAVALRPRNRLYVTKTYESTTRQIPFDEWMRGVARVRITGTATDALGSSLAVTNEINPHDVWAGMMRVAVDDDQLEEIREELRGIRKAMTD